MYALAAFFDIQYNITYPALPLGAIPPATSVFFELHSGGKHGDEHGEYVVKAVLWTPCDDEAHTNAEAPLMTIERSNDTQANNISTHYNASHHYPTEPTDSHHSTAHTDGPSPHSHTTPVSIPSAWSSSLQCGGRSVAIGRCHKGVCSFDEFRGLIHAQINRTGSWHTLCHPRQHSERYNHNHSLSNDDSDKVPGAGRTANHSPGYGATEGSDEEEKGNSHVATAHSGKHSGYNSSRGGNETAASDEKESTSSAGGWTVLFWVLLASAVIGGVGYYYFFVRGDRDRSEYQPVAGRP